MRPAREECVEEVTVDVLVDEVAEDVKTALAHVGKGDIAWPPVAATLAGDPRQQRAPDRVALKQAVPARAEHGA